MQHRDSETENSGECRGLLPKCSHPLCVAICDGMKDKSEQLPALLFALITFTKDGEKYAHGRP